MIRTEAQRLFGLFLYNSTGERGWLLQELGKPDNNRTLSPHQHLVYRSIAEAFLNRDESAKTEEPALKDIISLLELELFEELREIRDLNNVTYGGSEKYRLGSYAYFLPSYHFETGLINEATLSVLFKNPDIRVLSIGSGEAYLEQLLVKIGAVKKENITLCDEVQEPLPKDYRTKVFNVNAEWPPALQENNFDLIIFPESLSCCIDMPFQASGSRESFLLEGLNKEDVKALNRDAQFVVNNYSLQANNVARHLIAGEQLYGILVKCLNGLSPHGQIRMTHNNIMKGVLYFVEKKLNQEGYNIKIFNSGSLLVVERNKL